MRQLMDFLDSLYTVQPWFEVPSEAHAAAQSGMSLPM